MKKKIKKNIIVTQEEHDEWHRKNKGYDAKNDKEHEICHKEMGITVKKNKIK
jgi:hypothetical protein